MNLNEVRNILLELRDKNPDLSNQIDEIISKITVLELFIDDD